MTKNFSILPGTVNTRDLGGYGMPENTIRPHMLLRSDHLARTGQEDIALLSSWNVRTIIDLRRDEEVARLPAPEAIHREFTVQRIPFDNKPFFALHQDDPAFELWELYVYMLEVHAPRFAQAVTVIAQCLRKGGVLFHCSAGKDRAGMLAALLLGCARTPEQDIVADYGQTRLSLGARPLEEVTTLPPGIDSAFFHMLISCELRHMQKALAALTRLGGARAYLIKAGVSEQTLDGVVSQLMSKA